LLPIVILAPILRVSKESLFLISFSMSSYSDTIWVAAVQLFHQKGVHLFAVGHPLRHSLQCLVKKVVLAGDDVDKIADAARRMHAAVEVNVNPAGLVREPARAAEQANQLLQDGDVLTVYRYCSIWVL
jgi:hypothetical protein